MKVKKSYFYLTMENYSSSIDILAYSMRCLIGEDLPQLTAEDVEQSIRTPDVNTPYLMNNNSLNVIDQGTIMSDQCELGKTVKKLPSCSNLAHNRKDILISKQAKNLIYSTIANSVKASKRKCHANGDGPNKRTRSSKAKEFDDLVENKNRLELINVQKKEEVKSLKRQIEWGKFCIMNFVTKKQINPDFCRMNDKNKLLEKNI